MSAPGMIHPRLYHGGRPDMSPGDWLLPPEKTGHVSTAQAMKLLVGYDPFEHGLEADRARGDRVYLTTERDAARAHAGSWYWCQKDAHNGGMPGCEQPDYGALYVAEPDGELEPDPDFEAFPGMFFQCARARIVAVYDPVVILTWARWRTLMLNYVTGKRL